MRWGSDDSSNVIVGLTNKIIIMMVLFCEGGEFLKSYLTLPLIPGMSIKTNY